MFELRPPRPEDTRALELLARRSWPVGTHPGGLGWQLATEDMPRPMVVAERDGEIVAWAGITGVNAISAHPRITLEGAVTDPEAGAALLEWALARTSGETHLPVFHGDEALRSLAEKAGFTHEGAADTWMYRAATEESPTLPEGYVIRPVREGEEDARVECHRAAWKPADLSWPESVGPVDPKLNSRFSRAYYDDARASLLYDPELDLVVQAPDGSLAACCVVWFDEWSGASEVEPLGVVPAHRRRGLAAALVLAACSLTAHRGGERVFINTAPNPLYPAPAKTYATVGFEEVDRGRLYVRRDR
ncbi:GNAT family N-acetyltransferase [Nocardiopsis sp. JB363]|uniref:GNAT family N-acetyltransferase n=1 Tax=Nocardiopsis sp. JB363 TaxID=1434837 RepID=UPI00097AC1CA|nr:GNAT family N-acetyltransferase [Nocardiopsis sp. JB363]SIO86451.1 acetyltransferase, GNAT family [Nocardiopsis sp. JB363]